MRKRLAGIAGHGEGNYPRGTLQPQGRRAVAVPATTTLPPLPVQPALPSNAWPDAAVEPSRPLVRQGRGSSLPPLAAEGRNQRQQTSPPTSALPRALAPLTLRVATRAVSMASAAASAAVNRATSQRRDTLEPAARVPPGSVLAAPPASSRSNESEALLSSRTGATEANSSSGAAVPTDTASAQLSHREDDEGPRPPGPEKHAEGNVEHDSTTKAARSAPASALACGSLRPVICRTLEEGSRTSPEQAAWDAAKEALMRSQTDESLALALARTIEESPELHDKLKAKERLQHAFFEQRDRGLSPTSAALEILRR